MVRVQVRVSWLWDLFFFILVMLYVRFKFGLDLRVKSRLIQHGYCPT